MQTSLTASFLETPAGKAADEILRNCVHCGFCNATCPTYQLTGDELDGPRGRIYLIKQMLEGNTPSAATRIHLDRCLTCRACETTCPSGVEYHTLLDTGRELIETRVPRPVMTQLQRWLLRKGLTNRRLFTSALRLGQALRPLLPATLRQKIPLRQAHRQAALFHAHPRSMLLLDGCVQPALAPSINTATRRVLDALGINTIIARNSRCCGAVSHHLGAGNEARRFMRRNIDAWWPAINNGAEAIVITASGCAPMVKDYGTLLADDPDYADKAARVSALAKDISEVIAAEPIDKQLASDANRQAIAFHSPCSLQHGQKITGSVETILQKAGYRLQPVADSHLCCGSAGTWSILQPAMANELRDNKLAALQAGQPDIIATANIGCLMHMASHAQVPVKHWIELLEPEAN
ncbi:MAG: glycolate oxidase subunit GlcF [Pseudomonadota bacterium]